MRLALRDHPRFPCRRADDNGGGDIEHLFDSDYREEYQEFLYGGPFFVSCDHGCAHRPGWHGNGQNCGEEPPSYAAIFKVNMERIDNADVMFAFINEIDCHGTLVELGLAARRRKPRVALTFGPKVTAKQRRELWMAEKCAHYVYEGTAPEGWRRLVGEVLPLFRSPLVFDEAAILGNGFSMHRRNQEGRTMLAEIKRLLHEWNVATARVKGYKRLCADISPLAFELRRLQRDAQQAFAERNGWITAETMHDGVAEFVPRDVSGGAASSQCSGYLWGVTASAASARMTATSPVTRTDRSSPSSASPTRSV